MPFEFDIRESEIFQMGEKEGRKRALTIVLTERFGPLPPAIVEQIKHSARPQLDRWILQCLSAPASPICFPNEIGLRLG